MDTTETNKFTDATYEKMKTGLKGIDATVYKHVIENNLMPEAAIRLTMMDMAITNRDFTSILVENGFIKQSTIVDLSLKVRPEELADSETVEPSVPYDILRENKIMLCAITENCVYLATTESERVAEISLQKYFPKKAFKFIPANIGRINNYLQKIKVVYDEEGSFLDYIIRKGIRDGASDIHIRPEYQTYSVFFRYLGTMYPEHVGGEDEYHTMISKLKDLSRVDIAQKRKDQDGGFQIDYNGRKVDLRVVTIPGSYNKESAVIRILDPDSVQTNLSVLGISNVDDWRKSVSRPDGLCLICGPTGSGKTTTLNSTLRELDRFTKSIYTIEDPVEYRISNTTQINIDKNGGMTFASALKACMRGDPDIIVVGEVRDEDTARNMIKAAETGHLVIATLHTGQIRGAINRLRDLNIDQKELRYILRGVMAQRLMRICCPHCKGDGCDYCNDRGYVGRTVVSEVVYLAGVRDVDKLLNPSEALWWTTKEEDAYNKYKAGMTTKSEFVNVFGEEAKDILRENGEIYDEE
jgi:general secretion pathway protein E